MSYGAARHGVKTFHRTDGFATSHTVAARLSERAVRKTGKQTRPGLARQRACPATDFGRVLGRIVRPEGGRKIYAGHEQVVALIAPPRSGKTAQLGNDVIDACGAAVVTSTKVDIYEHTHALRALKGPLWLFNPESMSGLGSSFGWSPIQGCEDPEWAITTASYLVSGAGSNSGVQDSDFWDNQNVKVLRALLFAAAVSGKSMTDLAAWATASGDTTALRILEDHPDTPAGWITEFRQIMTTSADKTRESVFLTLQLIFAFMAQRSVVEAVTPTEDTPSFDIRKFVRAGTGTLYLLGSDKPKGGVGPLFAALTGLILRRRNGCPSNAEAAGWTRHC